MLFHKNASDASLSRWCRKLKRGLQYFFETFITGVLEFDFVLYFKSRTEFPKRLYSTKKNALLILEQYV